MAVLVSLIVLFLLVFHTTAKELVITNGYYTITWDESYGGNLPSFSTGGLQPEKLRNQPLTYAGNTSYATVQLWTPEDDVIGFNWNDMLKFFIGALESSDSIVQVFKVMQLFF